MKKMRYILPCLLFLQWLIVKEANAMEPTPAEVAKIIMPSAPEEKIIASFKDTDMPKRMVVSGEVQLKSSDEKQSETVSVSAAEIAETFKNLISDIGTDQPLLVQLTGNLFTKLVESLKALNTITTADPNEYSNAMIKKLGPLLIGISADQMLDLLHESNRLDIRPLTWYILALFATEFDQNKNLKELSTLIKGLARYKDKSDLTAKMLEAILPGGNLSWELPIPVSDLRKLAVKAVPSKGIIVLTDTGKNLYLWKPTESIEVMQKELEDAANANALDISEDGTKALVLRYEGTLQLWNLETGTIIRELTTQYGRTVAALSNDGEFVLANSMGRTVDLWDIENDAVKPLVRGVLAQLLKFSPDGRYALIGLENNSIRYIKIDTRQILKVLTGHTHLLASATFSNDGTHVLSGALDNTAILWDLMQEGRDLEPAKILKGFIMPVTSAAISSDNKYALTGSQSADLWDLESEKRIANYTIPGNKVSSVAFSSNGKLAVLGSQSAARSMLPSGDLSKEHALVVLWSLSKEHTLPEVVLFMKLNELGKGKVIEDPDFKELYDAFIGY